MSESSKFELARKRTHSGHQNDDGGVYIEIPVNQIDDNDLNEEWESPERPHSEVNGHTLLGTSSKPNVYSQWNFVTHLKRVFGFNNNKVSSENADSPSNGKWGTVFLLLNSMIGSGILNQPQVFSHAGLLGGLVLYAVCCTTMWFAQQILLQSGMLAKKMDYSELVRHCFGKWGGVYLDGAILVGGMLAICSYLTVIGGEGVAILHSWVGKSLGMEITSLNTLPAITLLFLLPLCLVRHFGHLAFVSVLSILAILLVMACVLIEGPSQGLAQGTQSQALVWFSFGGVFRKIGSVTFAFDCLVATFFAYESMETQTPAAWRNVTGTSMAIGAFMCLMTGISGYFSFRNTTEGDILDNFSGTIFTVVKFMVVLHLILYVPVTFVVMRHSFTKLVFGSDITKLSTLPYVILTVTLLGIPFSVVMVFFALEISEGDAFGGILDVTGALTDGAIALIIPGLIFIYLMRKLDNSNSKLGIYILAVGLFINIVVPVLEFV